MGLFTSWESFRKAGRYVKGANGSKGMPYQDPTYLGFLLLWQWQDAKYTPNPNSSISTPDYTVASPLFDINGAEQYLTRLAKSNEAKYGKKLKALQGFKAALKKINTDMPWYWQSLGGLNKAQDYNPAEPYIGGEESTIAIGCLESVNLAITGMMRLYREAVFDEESWTYVLPANLRKFAIKIYISEVRDLTNETNTESDNTGYDPNHDLVGENKKPYLAFMLTQCEFNLNSGIKPLEDGINNSVPTMAEQMISFKFERLFSVEMIGLNQILTEDFVAALGSTAPANPAVAEKKSFMKALGERAAKDMKALAEKKKQEAISTAANIARDATGIPFTMDGMKPKLEIDGIYQNLVGTLDRASTDVLNAASQATANAIANDVMGNVYWSYGNSLQQLLNNQLQASLGNIYKK